MEEKRVLLAKTYLEFVNSKLGANNLRNPGANHFMTILDNVVMGCVIIRLRRCDSMNAEGDESKFKDILSSSSLANDHNGLENNMKIRHKEVIDALEMMLGNHEGRSIPSEIMNRLGKRDSILAEQRPSLGARAKQWALPLVAVGAAGFALGQCTGGGHGDDVEVVGYEDVSASNVSANGSLDSNFAARVIEEVKAQKGAGVVHLTCDGKTPSYDFYPVKAGKKLEIKDGTYLLDGEQYLPNNSFADKCIGNVDPQTGAPGGREDFVIRFQ
jgi:hypothetical protein